MTTNRLSDEGGRIVSKQELLANLDRLIAFFKDFNKWLDKREHNQKDSQ